MERVGRVGGVGAKVLKDGWKSNGWMGGGGRALLYRPRAQRHLYIYIYASGRPPIPVRIQRVF